MSDPIEITVNGILKARYLVPTLADADDVIEAVQFLESSLSGIVATNEEPTAAPITFNDQTIEAGRAIQFDIECDDVDSLAGESADLFFEYDTAAGERLRLSITVSILAAIDMDDQDA